MFSFTGSHHRQIDQQLPVFSSLSFGPLLKRPVQTDDKFLVNPPPCSLLSVRTLGAIFQKQTKIMNNIEESCTEAEAETKLSDSDMDISEDETDMKSEKQGNFSRNDENIKSESNPSEVVKSMIELLSSKLISGKKDPVSTIRKQEELDHNYNPVSGKTLSKSCLQRKTMINNNSVASKKMKPSEEQKKNSNTNHVANQKQKSDRYCMSEKTVMPVSSVEKIATADDMKNFLNAGLKNENVKERSEKNHIKTKRYMSIQKLFMVIFR